MSWKQHHHLVFNHDGCGMVAELAGTPMREQDAVDHLIDPLLDNGITVIDWAILSTGRHNCRTRYRFDFKAPEPNGTARRDRLYQDLEQVVAHYNGQGRDLCDIAVARAHERGAQVTGCVRLNHDGGGWRSLERCPGRAQTGNDERKDFRDEVFHKYLADVFEDLLEKGVDGLTLDFERKAPFFAPDVPQQERFDACRAFVERIRKLTGKPLAVRVCREREKGEAQGQDPEGWMRAGLIDAVIPATHNHEPDRLDWDFDRFIAAAVDSPRPCAVWPQIWPVPVAWKGRKGNVSSPEAVRTRGQDILKKGANGIYFFNFCCYDAPPEQEEHERKAIWPPLLPVFAGLAKEAPS